MKTLLFVVLISLVGCSGGRNSKGYSLINDMMYSEAYEAFSSNPVFDNAQSMQPNPAGTVSRGHMPHPMDKDGNPLVLSNPYEMTDFAWSRGQELFEKTCSACHGVKGKADGLVVTKGGFPKPPSFSARRWKRLGESGDYQYGAGNVYNTVTFGYGNMASHAQQLLPRERWYVSEYVREKLMKKNKKREKKN